MQHENSCGGTYTKVKEPEGYGQKKTKEKKVRGNLGWIWNINEGTISLK